MGEGCNFAVVGSIERDVQHCGDEGSDLFVRVDERGHQVEGHKKGGMGGCKGGRYNPFTLCWSNLKLLKITT